MSASIRLEATAFPIEGLLARVRSGDLRVPEFQRSFKWSRQDVVKLVDSVHQSFPIGTLLLWKKAGPAERLKIGDLQVDAAASDGVLWVVDGQQRVTSLANALLSDVPGSRFDVAFDVSTGAWSQAKQTTLPLAIAVDSERLLDWLSARPSLPIEARRRAIHLGSALREYRVPVWIIETQDDASIREIFSRLNSLGKKLKPHEIFEALERSPTTSLSGTAQRLAKLGFGPISNKLIHQTLRAFQGEDFTSDRIGRARNSSVFGTIEQGLSNAVVLLREAGIPHIKLLPYNFALVLLGAFFAHHPIVAARNRELLRRWLWRGAVSGQQSGADLTWLRTMISAVAKPQNEAVQSMLKATLGLHQNGGGWVSTRFDLRSARSRLEALALLGLSDSAKLTDVAAALERGDKVFEEVLPYRKAVMALRKQGQAMGTALETIASRRPVIGGVALELRLVGDLHLTLKTAPGSPARRAAFDEAQRTLSDWIPTFFESKMRTLDSDRGPLDSMLLDDEVTDAA